MRFDIIAGEIFSIRPAAERLPASTARAKRR
jgi:hypothetical protein